MKYFVVLLLIIICLTGSVHTYAQSAQAVGEGTARTATEPAKDAATLATDTTRKKKVKSVGKELGQDVKKDATDAKSELKAGTSNIVKTLKPTQTGKGTSPGIHKPTDKAVTDNATVTGAKQLGEDVKHDVTALPSEVRSATGETENPVKDETGDLKKLSQQHHRKVLEDKVSTMQYSSDDPENAPWKKKMFSKDDVGSPSLSKPGAAVPGGMEDKASSYEDKLDALKSPNASGKALENRVTSSEAVKNNKVMRLADSLARQRDQLSAEGVRQSLLGAKKVYSDKYIKKLTDSLGGEKAAALLKTATAMTKTEASESDMLDKINQSMGGKGGTGFDSKSRSLTNSDAEKLGAFPDAASDSAGMGGDLSKFKLPHALLSKLPPLRGSQLDSKYLSVIDSMRDIVLQEKGLSLDEQSVTDDVKQTAVKKKPGFFDKLYFDGIIGFMNDSTINIVQLSPALGYHFTSFWSVGAGPNLLVQFQGKKLNALGGLRTFTKVEVWKQRAYFQLEDNINQAKISDESIRRSTHDVLGGVGAILPVTKSLGLNLCVLYRLSNDTGTPGRSPWVFRIGFSTIKSVKP